jgi:hypothetical protein
MGTVLAIAEKDVKTDTNVREYVLPVPCNISSRTVHQVAKSILVRVGLMETGGAATGSIGVNWGPAGQLSTAPLLPPPVSTQGATTSRDSSPDSNLATRSVPGASCWL